MISLSTVLPAIILWALTASAAIHDDARTLSSLTYDYVIVGGGTAGNVVANRLTENPAINVLVIEAGPTHQGVLDIDVPLYAFRTTPNTPWDWNTTTVPQPGLNNRTIQYHQGHVLGGSSSVNGMTYTRSSSDDYDRLAKVTGDSKWSWNSLVPYFKKFERFSPPSDGHNTTGEYDPSVHGTDGPLGISLPGYSYSLNPIIFQALSELSDEFPVVQDYNTGKPLGMGWAQSTIINGTRSSSASAYLADRYLQRKNLHVLVNGYVSTVSASTANGSINTVSFTQPTLNNTIIRVKATKEVILSAGFIHTPHILLNSGIGDAQVLKSLNISVVKDLPSVGKNVSDHPLISGTWDRNTSDTATPFTSNGPEEAAALAQWETNRTGPLSDGLTDQEGFFRLNASLPDVQSIFAQYGDPSPGPLAPHVQLSPLNAGPFSLTACLVTPLSRGNIQLNSTNPLGPPVVDIGLLSNPVDLLLLRQSLLKLLRFKAAPVFTSNLGAPIGGIADVVASDVGKGPDADVMDAFIRAQAFTVFHAVGSAAMSPKGASWGVVDPDLRVKGVRGLRVVDASVLPFIPTANTQAAVYVVAERAADMIKASK